MATITFKAKVWTRHDADENPLYRFVQVPTITRSHCDMAAFRRHPRYAGIANSDLFPNALARIARGLTSNGLLRLDKLPEGVSVDTSSFLATVTVEA